MRQHLRTARSTGADLLQLLLREWLLIAAALGLVVSSACLKRLPSYTRTDADVIFVLFVLLVVVKGLQLTGFFARAAAALGGRFAAAKLVGATIVLSMFLTNDVALLIVVPLTLHVRIARRDWVIIMEILAANAGSAVSPLGNPQNLFIYWFYGVGPAQFAATVAPLTAAFAVLLPAAAALVSHHAPRTHSRPTMTTPGLYLHLAALAVLIAAVLRILPPAAGAVAVIFAIAYDRKALRVDYSMLATFFCFFGLTDNLRSLISAQLQAGRHVFLSSALLSQIMSNVPAALLLADFTDNWRALLWGVNVGGFGSLIASMASIIGYRLYARAHPSAGDSRRFLVRFHAASYAAFAFGMGLYWIRHLLG